MRKVALRDPSRRSKIEFDVTAALPYFDGQQFGAADDAMGIMGARYNLALNGKRLEPCF